MFISFEGISGSGKTTLIKSLAKEFNSENVVITNSPYQDIYGIGDILKEKIKLPFKNYATENFIKLMLANHAIHFEKVIAPALSVGKVVLCDRWFMSTLAYQSCGSEMKYSLCSMIRNFMSALEIHHKITAYPNLNIVLEISDETMLERIVGRGFQIAEKDIFNKDNYDDLVDKYKKLFFLYQENTKLIDAEERPCKVLDDAKAAIDPTFNIFKEKITV